jgi:hypothetical protein
MRPDQIMKRVTGYREHGLPIALSVIQAVQEMNAPRARSRNANAEPASVFGITAGCKCGRFFVPDLDEFELFFVSAKRLENPVYAVTRQTKDSFNSPVD